MLFRAPESWVLSGIKLWRTSFWGQKMTIKNLSLIIGGFGGGFGGYLFLKHFLLTFINFWSIYDICEKFMVEKSFLRSICIFELKSYIFHVQRCVQGSYVMMMYVPAIPVRSKASARVGEKSDIGKNTTTSVFASSWISQSSYSNSSVNNFWIPEVTFWHHDWPERY